MTNRINLILLSVKLLIVFDKCDATFQQIGQGFQRLVGGAPQINGQQIGGGGLLPGLGGGGIGGGGGLLGGLLPGLGGGGLGGFPGGALPPGMTVTGDGCLCPLPKPKTKYIAVEVPKVVFVKPKEKAKIITIKEVVHIPKKEEKYDDDWEDEGDSMPVLKAPLQGMDLGGYDDKAASNPQPIASARPINYTYKTQRNARLTLATNQRPRDLSQGYSPARKLNNIRDQIQHRSSSTRRQQQQQRSKPSTKSVDDYESEDQEPRTNPIYGIRITNSQLTS